MQCFESTSLSSDFDQLSGATIVKKCDKTRRYTAKVSPVTVISGGGQEVRQERLPVTPKLALRDIKQERRTGNYMNMQTVQ
jgi:hypothetical protein